MTDKIYVLAVSAALGLAALAGCTRQQAGDPRASDPGAAGAAGSGQDHHGQHAHPSEGPHHGELAELGNGEYHAELVHDDSAVTVYVLDAAAKGAVPIDADELMVNLTHDGRPEQFKLAAWPEQGDPPGRSSRFISKDAELAGHLHEEGTQPRLMLLIDGRSYRGDFEHGHESGHGHEH